MINYSINEKSDLTRCDQFQKDSESKHSVESEAKITDHTDS